MNVNHSRDSYTTNLPSMQDGWPVKCTSWEDSSPPMSHLSTPTEDYCPAIDSSLQPFSQSSTCSSLQMISTTTSMTPPVQPIAPPAGFMQQSIVPQPSLAINQFRSSTVSDTPTPSPSSNDEECSASSPMSDKQSLSEYNDDLNLCKSKQEILNLIPKDVRVPQSK